MVTISPAENPGSIDLARALFLEYAGSLGFDLCFQDFERELSSLPGDYAPPQGRLLLAFKDEEPIGCAALRPFDPLEVCEIKRLYVRPSARGLGAGRALARSIIEEARVIGYRRMRLDAIRSMTAAVRLYGSLGFREIEPYRLNPIPQAVYMELALT